MVPRALPDARPGATSELADVAPELADAPPKKMAPACAELFLPFRRLSDV